MSKDDGGAALPRLVSMTGAPDQEGMSLRDWFAGMALSGLYADASTDLSCADHAELCFKQADAMLKERAK